MDKYRCNAFSIEERVKDLLSKMTIKEKVGQLNQKLYGWEAFIKTENGYELTEKFKEHVKWGEGMGALYGLFRADPWSQMNFNNGISKEDSAKVANMVQQYVKENTRLGIPVLLSEECPHGHQALDGTTFPCNIGMGSTWNPNIQRKVSEQVAKEISAKGAHLALVSTLDILRDPRWGRSEECFSEDALIASKMTEAVVEGIQGKRVGKEEMLESGKAVAVLKHFCAQGTGMGGHNAAPANIGERELREIFLPPMKYGAAAGALSCMAAYNEIDGVPCHSSKTLLTDILRGEYGFEGFVMADGCALDRLLSLTRNKEKAAHLALRAGVDLSLWDDVYTKVEDAVEAGIVSEELLDVAVERILYVKFKLGLFDNCLVENEEWPVDDNESRRVNLQASKESMVLLKNDGTLPLSKQLKNIAVIGPNANAPYNQLGDYTPPQRENGVVTVLRGIEEKVGADINVRYAQGCGVRDMSKDGFEEAINIAKESDVAVVVLGGSSARDFNMMFESNGAVTTDTKYEMDCGENIDVSNLELGGVQVDLIKEIVKTGTPTVVVLIQGRPHSIPWISENCNAILNAWYPGACGGTAVAEILFGDYNPSGKLATSMPRSAGQLPVYYNVKEGGFIDYYDSSKFPLYPFGHGLSYTEFKYNKVWTDSEEFSIDEINAGNAVNVYIEVENIGDKAGEEVIQLYTRDMESTISARVKELKGFTKEYFEVGEKKVITLQLGKEELSIWDIDMNFTMEPGTIRIMCGGSSETSIQHEIKLN